MDLPITESTLLSFALHLDCSFYYLLYILSHCSPMELQVIVGNDRGRCALPTHLREKGQFIYKPGKQNTGIVEKFMCKSSR